MPYPLGENLVSDPAYCSGRWYRCCAECDSAEAEDGSDMCAGCAEAAAREYIGAQARAIREAAGVTYAMVDALADVTVGGRPVDYIPSADLAKIEAGEDAGYETDTVLAEVRETVRLAAMVDMQKECA